MFTDDDWEPPDVPESEDGDENAGDDSVDVFSSISYNQVITRPKATQRHEVSSQNSAIDKENMTHKSTPVRVLFLLYYSKRVRYFVDSGESGSSRHPGHSHTPCSPRWILWRSA